MICINKLKREKNQLPLFYERKWIGKSIEMKVKRTLRAQRLNRMYKNGSALMVCTDFGNWSRKKADNKRERERKKWINIRLTRATFHFQRPTHITNVIWIQMIMACNVVDMPQKPAIAM